MNCLTPAQPFMVGESEIQRLQMPHPVDTHVGRKIREVRQMRGLSQSDLATRMSISFQQLQKYETGANRVSASRLFELSQICEVAVSYFFDGLGRRCKPTPVDDETARLAATLAQLPRGPLKSAITGLITEVANEGRSSG
ncbi:helix-turn-helix domain-containing protein [Aestuariibius insulae]